MDETMMCFLLLDSIVGWEGFMIVHRESLNSGW